MKAMRLPASSLSALIVLRPKLAFACAVCVGNNEDTRVAFIATTALLTFLPLVLIGSVIWYLRRRALQIAASQSTPGVREEPTPSRPGTILKMRVTFSCQRAGMP